jgi:hypothetical protein
MYGLNKWAFCALYTGFVVLCLGAFVEDVCGGTFKWTDWGYILMAIVTVYLAYDQVKFGLRV